MNLYAFCERLILNLAFAFFRRSRKYLLEMVGALDSNRTNLKHTLQACFLFWNYVLIVLNLFDFFSSLLRGTHFCSENMPKLVILRLVKFEAGVVSQNNVKNNAVFPLHFARTKRSNYVLVVNKFCGSKQPLSLLNNVNFTRDIW